MKRVRAKSLTRTTGLLRRAPTYRRGSRSSEIPDGTSGSVGTKKGRSPIIYRGESSLEKILAKKGYGLIAGVDEAGRGPLAGPVVASAVLIRRKKFHSRIDDSKKLTEKQRNKAFLEIIDNAYVGVGIVSEAVIDKINILNATRLAMEQAVTHLMRYPVKGICFIVDGNIKLNIDAPYECFPKADSRSICVACASIIAKVTRDRIMSVYHKLAPQYGFTQHKGYGTPMHFKKIRLHGPSIFHRKTFFPVSEFFRDDSKTED